jgi:hypothetical protein
MKNKILFNHLPLLLCNFVIYPVVLIKAMGKKPDLSSQLRLRVVQHHNEGKSYRQICQCLKISYGAVVNTIKVILR